MILGEGGRKEENPGEIPREAPGESCALKSNQLYLLVLLLASRHLQRG